MVKGLKIRYFMEKYLLCTGTPPEDVEETTKDLYVGAVIQTYDTFDEAIKMLRLIDSLYKEV